MKHQKRLELIKRIYPLNEKVLNFRFKHSVDDFFVEEQPISFTNSGAFLILKVKKNNCDTWELIDRIAKFLGIYSNEIGYAGLKDKNATTIQYISIPKKYSKQIPLYKSKKVEILETTLHNKKLNIGDLEGNKFIINLHDVTIEEINHIQKILKIVSKYGMPNYFGFQRFGKDSVENLEKAKDIIYGEDDMKDKKVSKMLVASYQSNFFNAWLVERINLSKEPQKLEIFDGDVFIDIKNDKFFTPKSIDENVLKSFNDGKIVLTGLLPGRKVFKAINKAREIEEKYDDIYIQEKGYRREAIVYPKNINCKYDSKNKICTLDFILPKGSYATVLIEYLSNRNFNS